MITPAPGVSPRTVVEPGHGFSAAEHANRVARLQGHMAAEGLDAVLLTTPHNIRYITGLNTEFWESPTRPWFVAVPATGDPVAVVPEIGAEAFARTWITDIRTWPAPRPDDDGITLLAAVLNGLPRGSGRIGAELGREMALRMPVVDLRRLEEHLGAVCCDASPAIWATRMVKSEAEIDRVRYICQLTCDTFDAFPTLIGSGMTERDAVRAARVDLLNRGADAVPFMPGLSGHIGVGEIISAPGERALTDGDLFFVDTGATYDGYFCDFDRTFAIGQPHPATQVAHQRVWTSVEAALALVRPGTTTDQLWQAMNDVLHPGAVPRTGSGAGDVGRYGHGLGLQLTEPPSHRPGDGTVLAENMVITIEPSLEFQPGRWVVHEENLVVRADGYELLTRRAPEHLPSLD